MSKTLFGMLAGCAGCFALVGAAVAQPASEDEAVALVKKLEGICTIDETKPGKPVVGVNL
jgi:hypothetical protein